MKIDNNKNSRNMSKSFFLHVYHIQKLQKWNKQKQEENP